MNELMIDMTEVRVGDLIQMRSGKRQWLTVESIDPVTGDTLKIRWGTFSVPRGTKAGQLHHVYLFEGQWRVRRANTGVAWSEYDACRTCHANPRMRCRRIGTKATVRLAPALDRPHAGRPKLSC